MNSIIKLKNRKIFFLFMLIGLTLSFQNVKADVIEDAQLFVSSGTPRCRNYSMSVGHNQTFNPGDLINFGFSVECRVYDILGSGVTSVSAVTRLTKHNLTSIQTGTTGAPFYFPVYTQFDLLNNIGNDDYPLTTFNGMTFTDLGNGWQRISGSNLLVEMPSGTQEYTAAAIYLYFHYSSTSRNMGSFGEHIIIDDPPTLTSSLSICGKSPVNGTLTATKTGGTAIGPITYQFDCDNNGTIEGTYTTTNNSQTHECSYSSYICSSLKIAKIIMTQQGVGSSSTTLVKLDPFCACN